MNRSDDLNSLDPTDLKILLELIRDPRIQIGDLSEKLGIARNTAQSRVRRMQRSGLLHDGGREIDLEAVGYDVVAFVTIEVNHRELDGVVGALRLIAQVLEVHEISGRGGLAGVPADWPYQPLERAGRGGSGTPRTRTIVQNAVAETMYRTTSSVSTPTVAA